MEQDILGRLWFGTQYGVSVFNGNHFRNIERSDGLMETEVFLIFNDAKNRPWFISLSNELYYYENDTVKKAKHKGLTELQLRTLRNIRSIIKDADGRIWLLGKGVFCIDGDSLFHKSYDNEYSNIDIRKHLGSYEVLCRLGWMPFTREFVLGDGIDLTTKILRGSCKYNKNYLVFLRNEIIELEPRDSGDMVVVKSTTMNSPVNRIKFIDNKYLWILTLHDGAYCIDVATHDTINYFPGKAVSDVLIDQEKNIWITTLTDGVYKIPYSGIKIFDKSTGLSNSSALSIAGNSNAVWVGMAQGSVCRLTNNTIHEFEIVPKTINGRVLNLDIDRNSNLYAATDFLLFKINQEGKSQPMNIVAKSFKSVKVYDSLVLCGTSSELRVVISGVDNHNMGKYDKRVTSICEYTKGLYAIGTLEGLVFTDLKSKFFVKDKFQLNEKINYISKDVFGKLWVATQNAGLYVFDGSTRNKMSTTEGLLSKACKHVFCNAEDSSIWISTNKGINQIVFEPNNANFRIFSFTASDGLPTNDVNQVFVRNDTLWAATSDGIAVMPVKKQILKIPEIVISNLVARNKSYSINDLLEFPYQVNTIEINFEGISISGGNKIKYKYKLSNLEKNWVTSLQNKVRYVGLEPGDYKFEVIAIDPKGQESIQPAVIHFKIHSPYWKTLWFNLLLISVGGLLIYIFIRIRLRNVRQEERNKSRLLQSEITSIRAQMNPHFIFNSLNSIQDFIFTNDKENANEYLSAFSSLMRLVLENSSRNFISIEKECQFLHLYLKLEQLRMNHRFEYEISWDDSVNPEMDEVPSMILQPIVENALLHGIAPKVGDCQLKVKFTSDGSQIYCSVIDDGVGLNYLSDRTKVNHRSFALKAINDRIKLLNSLQPRCIELRLSDRKNGVEEVSGTEALLTVTTKKPTI